MEKREYRDENWVCRNWIQMIKKSCKQCIFDALCTYLDNKNEQNGILYWGERWEEED